MIRFDSRVNLFVIDDDVHDTLEGLLSTGLGDGFAILEFKGGSYLGPVVVVPESEPDETMEEVKAYFENVNKESVKLYNGKLWHELTDEEREFFDKAYSNIRSRQVYGSGDDGTMETIYIIDCEGMDTDVNSATREQMLDSYIEHNFQTSYCQHSYDCCANWYRHDEPKVIRLYESRVVYDRLIQNI